MSDRGLQKINNDKELSLELQLLIDEANNYTKTWAEKILAVYNRAKYEGFTPSEARHLVEEKIFSVSKRYIRKILPPESKDTNKVKKVLISNEELVPHPPSTPKPTMKVEFSDSEYDPNHRDPCDYKNNNEKEKEKSLTEEINEEKIIKLTHDLNKEEFAATKEEAAEKEKLKEEIEQLKLRLELKEEEVMAHAEKIRKLEKSASLAIQEIWDKDETIRQLKSGKTYNHHIPKPMAVQQQEEEKEKDNDENEETIPISQHRKIIGELNARIMDLNNKEYKKYEQVIEIRNQRIALVIYAVDLKSVEVDQHKSLMLNR